MTFGNDGAVGDLVRFLDESGEYDFDVARVFPDSYESMTVGMWGRSGDPSHGWVEVSFTSDGEPYRSLLAIPESILPDVESMVGRIGTVRG